MATTACLSPLRTGFSFHVGMCLFIIGSTRECPSGYVGVACASMAEVTPSVWMWTHRRAEAQDLSDQEKLCLGPELLLSVSGMMEIPEVGMLERWV